METPRKTKVSIKPHPMDTPTKDLPDVLPEPQDLPPPAPPASTSPPAPPAAPKLRRQEGCPLPSLPPIPPFPCLDDPPQVVGSVQELALTMLGAFAMGASVAFAISFFSRRDVI